MKEWFALIDILAAKLPGLPPSEKALDKVLRTMRTARPTLARQVPGATKPVWQYHESMFDKAGRSKLAYLHAEVPEVRTDLSRMLWQRFEALTNDHRAICQQRLDVLVAVDDMRKSGISAAGAIAHCCRKADISQATYYEWRKMVSGHARKDWLAALAPSFSPATNGVVTDLAECHPQAWAVLASDFLRPEEPKFSACYRRMMAVAKKQGWAPIPAERTLRRHMDILVPKAAQILARKGQDAAKALFPAQSRSVAHLHAMQIVNTDGHKLDLHVSFPNREEWGRVYLMATQDVYSRKILSWVLCEAETWEAVRIIIGIMVEQHGIPGHLYMDNGRAFASKKISGGAKRRHRYRITEDEVAGLLKTLGTEAHFTTPRSGQSKPIERGWGDLAEEISKHPAMSGCYTGRSPQHKPANYGKRAVPLDELERHVGERIAEHNARVGRKTEMAKRAGLSFDQVFAASVADPATIITFASEAQRSLWMLTVETVTARKPDGAIHLFENRYWHPVLNNWIGKKVTARFDPSSLHSPIKIYEPNGRFLVDAECIDKSGFDCQSAAREIARARKAKKRDDKAALQSAARLNDLQLKEIMARGDEGTTPAAPPPRPRVTRIVTGNVAHAVAPAEVADEMGSYFSRALSRLSGEDGAVIPFPAQGDRPASIASGRTSEPKSTAFGSGKKNGQSRPPHGAITK